MNVLLFTLYFFCAISLYRPLGLGIIVVNSGNKDSQSYFLPSLRFPFSLEIPFWRQIPHSNVVMLSTLSKTLTHLGICDTTDDEFFPSSCIPSPLGETPVSYPGPDLLTKESSEIVLVSSTVSLNHDAEILTIQHPLTTRGLHKRRNVEVTIDIVTPF
ncbi:hypothetical protein DL89DRAFT_270904 [Linderina pennispora]|uniref:Uncharacterized protein n=1 Tax=Linderina pennispora TaxID=61395 RepID=A0A1Y1VW01_9FUNG|nr:uncharacterized protein DL89DRAFT_270904 [Linderina pennispora]ORX65478.1 hypothetical protein DL89DRAFT_270904 [Linderina pennispora]